jgi:hypothetical protein
MTMTTTILETMSGGVEFLEIPIDKIEADINWNSRKYIGDDDEGDGPDEHSFAELVESLKCDGQDTAVEVKEGSDGHYFLILGFRRFAAFKRIYKEGGQVKDVQPGCIRACVRKGLTEREALLRNGRENTARSDLNAADIAYLVHRLSKMGMTEKEIGVKLAISGPYVNMLHSIYRGTSDLRITTGGKEVVVFEHWRENPGRVPVQTMLELVRSNTSPRIKESRYLEILAKPRSKLGTPKVEKPTYDAAKTAETFGLTIGRLERHGIITVDSAQDWKGLLTIGKRMKFDDDTPENIERVTSAAKRGYERGKLVG